MHDGCVEAFDLDPPTRGQHDALPSAVDHLASQGRKLKQRGDFGSLGRRRFACWQPRVVAKVERATRRPDRPRETS
jgi:hypothetical protein